MRFTRTSAAAAALAVLPTSLAQTFTSCDPTQKTCPADTGLNAVNFNSDFTQGDSAFASWSAAQGTSLTYGSQGAEFIINKAGQAPTVQTDFYIFFGKVEVTMRAAAGTGIVSSIVLESDDLDEIDWEFLGGNTAQVETNYFGKGNTTSYDRAIYYPIATPQDTFHTYTIDWTSSQIQWIIDGTVVRTLAYGDANGGANFPQTPMVLKLGNWAGGADGQPEGTVEWAGGKTDFSRSPFTMYVKDVKVTNYNPAESYTFGDKSGSYQSIVLGGKSTSSGSSSSESSASASTTTTSLASTAASNQTVTTAPTSDATVAAIQNTGAAVSVTSIGSAYSTNTASASALNANSTAIVASTQVPGAEPTASATMSSSSSSGSDTSGATSLNAMALTSLGTLALAFFML